jgi:hypothetical protein
VNESSRETLDRLLNEIPNMIEHIQIMAQLTKVKYDALIAEGFTETQALELCKIIP